MRYNLLKCLWLLFLLSSALIALAGPTGGIPEGVKGSPPPPTPAGCNIVEWRWVDGDKCDQGRCFVPILNCCGNGKIDPPYIHGDSDSQMNLVESCDKGTRNGALESNCTESCQLPRCGNGLVEIENPIVEICDDGNSNNLDACTNNCESATCGDSILQDNEECDQWLFQPAFDPYSGKRCSNTCTAEYCGDGTKNGSEDCDDGNKNNLDACSNQCETADCGDGVLQNSEQCDGAFFQPTYSNIADKRCLACLVEYCGDGTTNGTEQCDDGNTSNTDSCSTTCRNFCGDNTLQSHEQCDGTKFAPAYASKLQKRCVSCVAEYCGDRIQNGSEECDDGNSSNTDSCSTSCKKTCGDGVLQAFEQCDGTKFATAYKNKTQLSCDNTCVARYCGDNITNGAELCDDGNLVNNDNCTNACLLPSCGDYILSPAELCDGTQFTTFYQNKYQKTCVNCEPFYCGDGIKNGAEFCDDGNLDNLDSCTTLCRPPFCGDGFQQAGELCDDGNTSNLDACLNTCVPNACGDGYRNAATEGCDDANSSNLDACLNTCQPNTCGDGFQNPNTEICDDGNSIATDSCTNQCKLPVCGDGIKWQGVEQCDDGNKANTDACLNTCIPARCGDGYKRSGVEACDDGDSIDTNSCRNNCTYFQQCGNSKVEPGEDCDYGVMNSSKGCNPTTCKDNCKGSPEKPYLGANNTVCYECFLRKNFVDDGRARGASNECWICVNCRYPSSGCFDPNTDLLKADGSLVRAKDAKVGDVLFNPMTQQHFAISQVIESREEAGMIQIETELGAINLTAGHPVLTARGLIRADALKSTDLLYDGAGAPLTIKQIKELPVDPEQRVINFLLDGASETDLNEHLVVSSGIITGDLFAQLKIAEENSND